MRTPLATCRRDLLIGTLILCSMSQAPAYIIAARRTALGRIGGLHRNRRIAELAAPVVDGRARGLRPRARARRRADRRQYDRGRQPARLIALSSGLPETAAAATIDRQCASGLDAILAAIRSIGVGDADVIVAGGAEAISTAPWRIAKPKSLYQLPHFMTLEPTGGDSPGRSCRASRLPRNTLRKAFGISRARQDA